jgi:hypothetical protein
LKEVEKDFELVLSRNLEKNHEVNKNDWDKAPAQVFNKVSSRKQEKP